jgi:cytochrome b
MSFIPGLVNLMEYSAGTRLRPALAVIFESFAARLGSGTGTMKEALTPVRVWDLPTRAFHWTLALCVIASITSAYIGGNAMVWHFRLGYTVFALLMFRILWGLIGGHWSRFANFVYAPATTFRYLRGASLPHEHHDVGHNPLGAFSVFGLLVLLAAQVGTGLFADDEISNSGPLIKFVSGATSLSLTKWHRNIGQWVIIALIVLHVAAILYYLLRKKQNLVRPMVTGDKHLVAAAPSSVDNVRSRVVAVVLVAACAFAVAWIINLGA